MEYKVSHLSCEALLLFHGVVLFFSSQGNMSNELSHSSELLYLSQNDFFWRLVQVHFDVKIRVLQNCSKAKCYWGLIRIICCYSNIGPRLETRLHSTIVPLYVVHYSQKYTEYDWQSDKTLLFTLWYSPLLCNRFNLSVSKHQNVVLKCLSWLMRNTTFLIVRDNL